MNFDMTKEKLFDVLTSTPWDGGVGRKMLFLKKRYYVFDSEHLLLDGGVINYNETLDKIFIRNEDLRGEVFITLEKDDIVHLKGSVFSRLAGNINIDTTLIPYDKELHAPLSRVAKIEKYLNISDIYKILMGNINIDSMYLKNFDTNLHAFTPEQSQNVYIKLSQFYFQSFDAKVLDSISYYFSSYSVHAKLYEEMFMFIMGIEMFYERGEVTQKDLDYFISKIQVRLLDAYAWKSDVISVPMINETLFYFKLESDELPTMKECVQKLFDRDVKTQREHAYYLSLMGEGVREFEEDIFDKLLNFYRVDFYLFKEAFLRGELLHVKIESDGDISTLLALIEVLVTCRSESKEVYIYFLFLALNEQAKVQEYSTQALLTCKEELLSVLEKLPTSHVVLKEQIMQLLENSNV